MKPNSFFPKKTIQELNKEIEGNPKKAYFHRGIVRDSLDDKLKCIKRMAMMQGVLDSPSASLNL